MTDRWWLSVKNGGRWMVNGGRQWRTAMVAVMGFGDEGRLNDGREIVVKKLSQSSNQGKNEYKNEAKLLARVQYRNVVNLLGYCAHGAEKLLVYEYVANESLEKLLFKSFIATTCELQRIYEKDEGKPLS
ncbi:Cysteine-rich receptor-like protein kinase 10 [Camellia lanceoleosa]|uniref:Cysteine-rich receptor-like protein kinase 10 n=1 Tax=Camellia lanceoleosa TaxID=1840588 RepID=A0ACC0F2G0_9ERIC|nr:Cysteine-rich receptor-like protein kinase 10 [Camellia lanceoleosa]